MDSATPLLPQQDTSLMHQSFMNSILSSKKYLYIVMGPLACLLICLFADMGVQVSAKNMLGAMVWIFIWWLTEAVPVPVTSMAPLYLLPLLGITSADAVARCYMNDVVALVIGSFILAIAVEHYNIHQRLALNQGLLLITSTVLATVEPYFSIYDLELLSGSLIGSIYLYYITEDVFYSTFFIQWIKITLLFCGDPPSPRLLLLGICGTTMFISFWMQNIAAAVMMMPVATGILQRLPDEGEETDPNMVRFSKAMVLGVMYSAAIGGIATLTGTGVNLVTVGVWATSFPEEKPISFSSWFFFGFPIALVMFLALWGILCFLYCSKSSGHVLATCLDRNHLQRELQNLGPMIFAEKMILSVFFLLIVLWMTRSLTDDIPGWGILFNDNVGDGTVSVMAATLLFVLPNMKQKGEKLMDWNKCKKLQWNVVLLLGAGFAIADGVQSSGLADMLSESLSFLSTVPYLAVPPIVCLISSIITEFTSNNATATLVLPVLIQIAKTMGFHPLILMIPGAIGAQFAYWLPTGTPPNLVGFATGHIGMVDMLKTGIPLKMIGIASIGLLMPTLGVLVFGATGEKLRDM